jgi:methylthioribose-1-phosphate isomerase
LERKRHSESGLSKILAISKVVGLTQHETRDLIAILDDAATAIKDMEVRGAPLISDYGIS